MRRADPIEPEVAAALAAIDATLAGERVEPRHAELAELALILSAQRPAPSAAVAGALDRRVADQLAARGGVSGGPNPEQPAPRRWRRWLAAPAAAAAAIALVVVVVGQGGQKSSSSGSSSSAAASSGSFSSASSSSASSTSAALTPMLSPVTAGARTAAGHAPAASAAATATTAAGSTAPTGAPPVPAASRTRQVVQSGRLSLSATPGRIDAVAQEVFDVVDAEHGFVTSSQVTATGRPDGRAHFQLSVPEDNLRPTMSRLSELRGAHVISRSDATADITGQVGGAGQQLAEMRAGRRSLLRQLAAATTLDAIAGLKAKLRAVDAAIARDAGTLNGLHRAVDYSTVTVSIHGVAARVPPPSRSGGFTLHRALHDAGRVLVVVAGVALIALAVLIPLGLVVAVMIRVIFMIRRHRREAALDLV